MVLQTVCDTIWCLKRWKKCWVDVVSLTEDAFERRLAYRWYYQRGRRLLMILLCWTIMFLNQSSLMRQRLLAACCCGNNTGFEFEEQSSCRGSSGLHRNEVCTPFLSKPLSSVSPDETTFLEPWNEGVAYYCTGGWDRSTLFPWNTSFRKMGYICTN